MADVSSYELSTTPWMVFDHHYLSRYRYTPDVVPSDGRGCRWRTGGGHRRPGPLWPLDRWNDVLGHDTGGAGAPTTAEAIRAGDDVLATMGLIDTAPRSAGPQRALGTKGGLRTDVDAGLDLDGQPIPGPTRRTHGLRAWHDLRRGRDAGPAMVLASPPHAAAPGLVPKWSQCKVWLLQPEEEPA